MRGCELGTFAEGAAVVLRCGKKKGAKSVYRTDAAPAIVAGIKEMQGTLLGAGAQVSTRILVGVGERRLFPPFLLTHRVPHGLTQDPSTDSRPLHFADHADETETDTAS